MGKAIALGIELAISVALFTYLGVYIDKKMSITLFVIIMPLLALTGGVLRILWTYKKELK